jgi:hypothetical protein
MNVFKRGDLVKVGLDGEVVWNTLHKHEVSIYGIPWGKIGVIIRPHDYQTYDPSYDVLLPDGTESVAYASELEKL